jgi:predicted acetyltransferase
MCAQTPRPPLRLLEPSIELLPAYSGALARGWSPNNVEDVSAAQLASITQDAAAFLASLLSQTGTIKLPDGSEVPKLPSRVRWMWDGEFVGHIGMRWQPGSDALPSHVLGHIGYAVVPWKRRRGYATEALRLMLMEAVAVGLCRIEITTDGPNVASRRVIEANGGRFLEEFVDRRYGDEVRLRYCIDLPVSGAKSGSEGLAT